MRISEVHESVQLCPQTFRLAADSDDIAATTALEWLTGEAVLFTIWCVVDQLALTIWLSMEGWLELLLYLG
jgi:hypothetical protein